MERYKKKYMEVRQKTKFEENEAQVEEFDKFLEQVQKIKERDVTQSDLSLSQSDFKQQYPGGGQKATEEVQTPEQ